MTNAPAFFQTLVNDLLRDYINVFVVVYLDNILENRLFVKAKKCVFDAASVEFLGHILEKAQVRADPKKVRAVEEWARPADRTQLRRFLRSGAPGRPRRPD